MIIPYTFNEMEVNMKKLVFAAIFIVSLAVVLPVFAQSQKDERDSEFYYVNVTLEKVFPYRKGYVVQYRKGLAQFGRVYLPAEWFTDVNSKGEIITLPAGTVWPSLSVYYKNGEFSHVRLYIHRLPSHESWGFIPQSVDIEKEFDAIETIMIEY
jgi:hypothetical protein